MNIRLVKKYINESQGNFDFLGHDKINEKNNEIELQESKDFQISLIKELGTINSDKIINEDITMIKDDDDTFNFTISGSLEFKYQDSTLPIYFTIEGNMDDYSDSEIAFFGIEGYKIDMKWLHNNTNLKKKFVYSLVNQYEL